MFNQLTFKQFQSPHSTTSAFFSNEINRISVLQYWSFYITFWRFSFFFFRRKIGKINGNGLSVNYITVNGHVKIFSVPERKPAPQMCMRQGDGTKLPESVMRFQEIHPSTTSLSSILRAVSRSVYEENGRCRG